MSKVRYPGVYIEETSGPDNPVASVPTSVPIFVGYTARRPAENPATPVGSFLEFQTVFGNGKDLILNDVHLSSAGLVTGTRFTVTHYLRLALSLFYANGGGKCYVKSMGTLPGDGTLPAVSDADITAALLDELATLDEPAIVVFPDHPGSNSYASVIQHCATLGNRTAILDVADTDYHGSQLSALLGEADLSYAAAYTPWLRCVLPKGLAAHDFAATTFALSDGTTQRGLTPKLLSDADPATVRAATSSTASEAREEAQANLAWGSNLFRNIMRGVNYAELLLPPSGAVAGVYATVDAARGVWKAPANLRMGGVVAPDEHFTGHEMENLGNPRSGQSINVIRQFPRRGTRVFGARTLAGHGSAYRYISVRRLMNMIQESCTKACTQFRLQPNGVDTWMAAERILKDFLVKLWRAGALQGTKSEAAFYVTVGPGKTMTDQDVVEGRMIVLIGAAPVRPAEFITVRLVQQLTTA